MAFLDSYSSVLWLRFQLTAQSSTKKKFCPQPKIHGVFGSLSAFGLFKDGSLSHCSRIVLEFAWQQSKTTSHGLVVLV